MDENSLNTQNGKAGPVYTGNDEAQARAMIKANFPRLSETAWQVLLNVAPYLPPHTLDGNGRINSDAVDPSAILELARDFDEDYRVDEEVRNQVLAMSPEEVAAMRLVAARYERHWAQDFPADLSLASILATISGRKGEEVFQ